MVEGARQQPSAERVGWKLVQEARRTHASILRMHHARSWRRWAAGLCCGHTFKVLQLRAKLGPKRRDQLLPCVKPRPCSLCHALGQSACAARCGRSSGGDTPAIASRHARQLPLPAPCRSRRLRRRRRACRTSGLRGGSSGRRRPPHAPYA